MKFPSSKVTTKRNNTALLRMMKPDEAENLLAVMVEIAKTSPYILTLPEAFLSKTVEEEIKWIESYNEDPRGILIAAEIDDKIAGILDFRCYKNIKSRHRGMLGISLVSEVRGEGLGELLFNRLIGLCKNIEGLMYLDLSVMSENIQAYSLYKKMGFEEVGRKPMAFKQPDGSFCDEVQMALKLPGVG